MITIIFHAIDAIFKTFLLSLHDKIPGLVVMSDSFEKH